MRAFSVSWSDVDLRILQAAVAAYSAPPAPTGSGWRYGCDPDFLAELCAYWVGSYDPRILEAELNRFPQAIHRVENFDLHAVHLVGEAEGRRPLLLCHGWPGSIHEFYRVAEPLAFPSRHGGRAEDAFDLVIPSLPGFGFSSIPATFGPVTRLRSRHS